MEPTIVPLVPALHIQPLATLLPVLFDGQGTFVQELLKYGADVVSKTRPEKPVLHLQPAGTLTPSLFEGHGTTEKKLFTL